MMETTLSIVVLGVVSAATWLLPKYLERRVAEAARGAVDVSVGKTLAEHRHALDRQLERSSKDYGLFAERRNEIYAETYTLFEKARGHYAMHFATLTQTRDFSKSGEPDLRHLAKKLDLISEGERSSLTDALDMHNLGDARRLANELYKKDSLRTANQAFYAFKSAWVLHALYFSTEVNDVLVEAARTLGLLSVYADELIEEGKDAQISVKDRRDRAATIDKLDAFATRLRTAMRAEMQRGFEADHARPTG